MDFFFNVLIISHLQETHFRTKETYELKAKRQKIFQDSSIICGTVSSIEYQLVYKTSLNKFQKTEITSGIFSGHNGMKLQIDIFKP